MNIYHNDDIPDHLKKYFQAAPEIGLGKTPQAYIAKMVEVFREVRRILRKDGTLWLNLGDSYAGSRAGGGGGSSLRGTRRNQVATSEAKRAMVTSRRRDREPIPRSDYAIPGLKPKDLIGIPWRVAFALQQPYVDWIIPDPTWRGWVAGIIDGEGCITILKTKSSHCQSLSFPPVLQVRMADKDALDRLVELIGSKLSPDQLSPSAIEGNQRPSWQWKIVSDRAAQLISEIYPYLTVKRKQAIVAWNHQKIRSERGNQKRKGGEIDLEIFCKKLINDLNQRRQVDIPSWMEEPRIISQPGWYLRQGLIWHKPNAMPESAKDRCTKAHEDIFLMAKSRRYYYNAEAIREPAKFRDDAERNYVPSGWDTGPGAHKAVAHNTGTLKERYDRSRGKLSKTEPQDAGRRMVENTVRARQKSGVHDGHFGPFRNKRSVWTISTKGFIDAHFATFPTALVEPMILAGCPKGGTVLDPFCGAVTVGLVAAHLGREFIGIDLNPAYLEMGRKRINGNLFPEQGT
jgi:DNA modification methylase